MPFSLLPGYRAKSVAEISPAFLREKNIRLLMLDFDNTIVPYTTNTPAPEITAWLKEMQASGILLCVVSNSKKERVQIFCRERGIPCIIRSRKPFPVGIPKCLTQFGVAPNNAAIAGDQIFTDTLGGNCAGVTSILVNAIDNHNIWLKLRHVAELPFIYAAKNRRV